MNKIYKIVWSKVKHCYVVASELVKSHTKSPSLANGSKITILSLAITFMLNVGSVVTDTISVSEAGTTISYDAYGNAYIGSARYRYGSSEYTKIVNFLNSLVPCAARMSSWTGSSEDGYGDVMGINIDGRFSRLDKSWDSSHNDDGMSLSVPDGVNVSLDNLDSLKSKVVSGSGGTTYTAGNGITIGSDNKVSVKASNGIDVGSNGVSVKAGTNVTVNANGVSVTGNGSVADGNTGLINGDKLYDEVRSSANGNYVKTNNTTAANLKALDDKIGAASVANGTYIKTGNTVNANLKALDSQIGELNEDGGYIQKNNNVSQNLAALDNAIDNVVNSGLQFGANSGDDVTNKIGSKVSIIGGGTKADSEYDSKNIKTIRCFFISSIYKRNK